eukprot:gene17266-biopygen13840
MDDIVPALRKGLPDGVQLEIVLYADDVTVLLRGGDLDVLYGRAQRVLDNLSHWEGENQARVSLEKSSVTVFTPGGRPIPARRRPRLQYLDRSVHPPWGGIDPPPDNGVMKLVQYAATPNLPGLVYDEMLSFRQHASQLREKLRKRGRTVAALSGTKWGCGRRTLRATHLAYVQAKADYGIAAYAPFAPPAALTDLNTEQYFAACKISGCPRGTRTAVAHLEAGLQTFQQRVDYSAAMMYERCLRLPRGNRARAIAENSQITRTTSKEEEAEEEDA